MNANEKHGCHGGDGSTLPMNPPILTAEMADEAAETWRDNMGDADEVGAIHAALVHIATGRTVVVPVMTEAQAREAFDNADICIIGSVYAHRDTWLAALRHAGVLK